MNKTCKIPCNLSKSTANNKQMKNYNEERNIISNALGMQIATWWF